MTLNAPKRRTLRLSDFDYSDPTQIFFVTVAARKRVPSGRAPFSDAGLALEVIHALHYLRDHKGVSLLGYCLMPDHLHVLVSPSEHCGSLVDIVRDFKSYTTRAAWSYGWSGRLWARSFHDRAMRTAYELVETCQYMLSNPVKAGLVEAEEDYPYSYVSESLPI